MKESTNGGWGAIHGLSHSLIPSFVGVIPTSNRDIPFQTTCVDDSIWCQRVGSAVDRGETVGAEREAAKRRRVDGHLRVTGRNDIQLHLTIIFALISLGPFSLLAPVTAD